jgi:LysR family transcriptional regulator, transcriptional activator of nhaA
MASINFRHLMYFRAVAHDGNLTRTAAKLHLSQSALSVQIRALEARFGHALFERRGRALHLTEAGRIALDGADAIFGAGEEIAAALADAGSARPELRVGALATLSRNFQLDFLRPVLARGEARIVLRSGGEAELLGELAALNLDVVLLNRPPGREGSVRLVTHRLAQQRVALVGTRKRVRGARSVAEWLVREPLILPTVDSGVRTAFDALADRLGVIPRVAAEVEDMAMMRLLAREGVGLAVLPPIVVKDELAAGSLIEAVRLPGLSENFYAVTLRRRFPNPVLRDLLRGGLAPSRIAAYANTSAGSS